MKSADPVKLICVLAAVVVGTGWFWNLEPDEPAAGGRSEVVFWHFWGGRHREVVDEIVARFNRSQSRYFVRAVAMPGQNLDLKFFLSVTGGNPPDLMNHDDPVVADWAHRGVLTPIDELASPAEVRRLRPWLVPAAWSLGTYDDRLYALCNGLDIRALYYDQTVLDEYGLSPPKTIEELDAIARTMSPPDAPAARARFGYLPDPRRLWAWGIVFGGRFYDDQTERVTADSRPIVDALRWMASYSRLYGAEQVSAFRQGDQALAGAASPLLQGRYVLVMDGQWRVAEIAAVQQAARHNGQPVHQYGVVPLPPPQGGQARAGWVNGNFFVVPRGAANPDGAWEFMKFWTGFDGYAAEAARTCAAGGWIPVSKEVTAQPAFQDYLDRYPLFRQFVALAESPHQIPVPPVPVAALFYREVILAAEATMYRGRDPRDALREASDQVQARLTAIAKPREKSP